VDANRNAYELSYDELRNSKAVWKDFDGSVLQVRQMLKQPVGDTPASYTYVNYAYDELKRVIRVADIAGNTMTLTYDSLGRKLATTDPDMGTWTYSYDDSGNLLTQKDGKGQITSFGYDRLNRKITKTSPDGNNVSWYYDEDLYGFAVGHLTREVYKNSSVSHAFDRAGREFRTNRCVLAVCKLMVMTYDKMSRLDKLTYPDDEIVDHVYDATGRLTQVVGYASFGYNSQDQITRINGARTYTDYTYDPYRTWLASTTIWRRGEEGAADVRLYSSVEDYLDNAQVKSHIFNHAGLTDGTINYFYDAADQLIDVRGTAGTEYQTYEYNGLGNMMSSHPSTTHAYGAGTAGPHAMTSMNRNGVITSFSYDANGNMTVGGGRTYNWTTDNMLASVTKSAITTSYNYEGEKRVSKTVGGVTTRYFDKYVDSIGDNAVQYYYAGPVLIAKKENGFRRWIHSDRLGSNILMTDSLAGRVKVMDYLTTGASRYSYGNERNDIGFTGHRSDDESDLIYMGARYYDPTIRRFVSPDTVVPDASKFLSFNRYVYANNNPIANVDPDGHDPMALLNSRDTFSFVMRNYSTAVGKGPIAITPVSYGSLRGGGMHKAFLITISGTDPGYHMTNWGENSNVNWKNGGDVQRVVADAIYKTVPEGSTLIFAGHSQGGMVAQQAAADVITQNRGYKTIQTTTFGSPFLNETNGTRQGNLDRFTATNDKVPKLSGGWTFARQVGELFGRAKDTRNEVHEQRFGSLGSVDPIEAHNNDYGDKKLFDGFDAFGQRGGDTIIRLDTKDTKYFGW
jgi:RHS repeat-associated protein